MLTVPNLISIIRLLAIPVFLWLLLGRNDTAAAAWVLAAIGATDWVDGVLARRLRQVSELGKFLDPLADRAAIAAALIGGWWAGVVPSVLALPLLIREGIVAMMTAWLGWRKLPKLEVRYMGKAATLLLYVAIPAFYLAGAGVASTVMVRVGWVVGTAGLALYYLVLGQYWRDVRTKLAQLPE